METPAQHRGELAGEEHEGGEAHPAREAADGVPDRVAEGEAGRPPEGAVAPRGPDGEDEAALLAEAQDQVARVLGLRAAAREGAHAIGHLVLEHGHARYSWSATTATTSSTVVWPWSARRKPAWRSVVIPSSVARCRIVSPSAPSSTMRRIPAFTQNTS